MRKNIFAYFDAVILYISRARHTRALLSSSDSCDSIFPGEQERERESTEVVFRVTISDLSSDRSVSMDDGIDADGQVVDADE